MKTPYPKIDLPNDMERQLLEYWQGVLKPKKGQYCHPEDKKNYKRYRKAIKVLLEFFE